MAILPPFAVGIQPICFLKRSVFFAIRLSTMSWSSKCWRRQETQCGEQVAGTVSRICQAMYLLFRFHYFYFRNKVYQCLCINQLVLSHSPKRSHFTTVESVIYKTILLLKLLCVNVCFKHFLRNARRFNCWLG